MYKAKTTIQGLGAKHINFYTFIYSYQPLFTPLSLPLKQQYSGGAYSVHLDHCLSCQIRGHMFFWLHCSCFPVPTPLFAILVITLIGCFFQLEIT